MKTIVTTFAIAAFTLLAATPQAEARGHKSRIYISGYQSCGTPIYCERYFVGYDECGHEIWEVRRVRQQYRPVVREHYTEPCESQYRRSAKHDRGERRDYGSSHERSINIQASFSR